METLEDRIKRHEGLTLLPKYDAKGMYVIGYGHDIDADTAQSLAQGCTESDAEEWLKSDLDHCISNVGKYFAHWIINLNQARLDVITEMVFQIGIDGVAQFRRFITACINQDWDDATREMLDSDWHKQTPERCEELASIMLSGIAT